MDRSKIIILVTGTDNKPWDKNWKECAATWIPLVRQLGYHIKVAIGDPSVEGFLDEGETIRFRASDCKKGLVDKSLICPMKWILEETEYQYYIRVDSDTFVHPHRFDRMVSKNILEFHPDYMGACVPVNGIDLSKPGTFWIEREAGFSRFASGSAYMVSRRVMPEVIKRIRVENEQVLEWDDYVLGRAMHEMEIPLLHDSAISIESKWNIIVSNPHGLKVPAIEEKDSHLAAQHYQNGHMAEILLELLS